RPCLAQDCIRDQRPAPYHCGIHSHRCSSGPACEDGMEIAATTGPMGRCRGYVVFRLAFIRSQCTSGYVQNHPWRSSPEGGGATSLCAEEADRSRHTAKLDDCRFGRSTASSGADVSV